MVHSRSCHQGKCSGKAVFISFIPQTWPFLAVSFMYQDPDIGFLSSSARMPDCTALDSNSWLTLNLLRFQDWLRGNWTLTCQMSVDWWGWSIMEVGGNACLQLHWPTFTQLEGLNHMEQKIPGFKSGQSVHFILMAGSQKRLKEKLPDGFYYTNSLNSNHPFLSLQVSQPLYGST